MMGFGASTLLLGKLADMLFASPVGWRKTYIIIGVAIAVVIALSSFAIKAPTESDVLPEKKVSARAKKESFEVKDYTPSEMVRRFTFWRAFLALVCLTAAGSSESLGNLFCTAYAPTNDGSTNQPANTIRTTTTGDRLFLGKQSTLAACTVLYQLAAPVYQLQPHLP